MGERPYNPYTDPPATTPAGEVVLYRAEGDCWQVAGERDIEFVTGLSRVQREVRKIEVLYVVEAQREESK